MYIINFTKSKFSSFQIKKNANLSIVCDRNRRMQFMKTKISKNLINKPFPIADCEFNTNFIAGAVASE